MPDPGMVYLIGAGPGDPGLLTIKGRNCIQKADVIVYDYLANPKILQYAREGSERIYVGKQASKHAMEQHEINALLVAKAKEGKVVARLKGGDPYVFGRGGEEGLDLLNDGIPFEVVPGVTSAIAAPAYAGIPVTHREFNSVLTLLTGHEDPTKPESALDWKALADRGGTLAIYMGVKNLPNIVKALTENGRSPDTPVALVRWGTMPQQRAVTGTLADIVERVAEAGLKPPCIIVVGEVVKLRESLNWFENRPLFGKTIVVTRSRQQASELVEKLSELGANTLEFPTIRFEPPEDPAPMEQAARGLARYDWVVFTSPNAVERFFATVDAVGIDSRSLSGCKVFSIGPGTTAHLAERGIRPDLTPQRFTSAGIFEALSGEGEVAGKRFLLPRADLAGADLPQQLKAAGADVDDIISYRTLPGEPAPEIIEALRDGEVDMVTFTSSSTARNFANIVREQLGGLPDGVQYASIGPETSKTAREEKLEIALQPQDHTIDALVAAIVDYYRSTDK